eukprot:TRINITY_DN1194_c3_g1_i3.p1 TRINITY_DN1194_c3_g1~~TRINITY_DN1194_c3_g1_i3.p1  ORF type:complete len:296 (-),score=72.41 TRINITY_DN1194_c3_g1_i3:35-922(-)
MKGAKGQAPVRKKRRTDQGHTAATGSAAAGTIPTASTATAPAGATARVAPLSLSIGAMPPQQLYRVMPTAMLPASPQPHFSYATFMQSIMRSDCDALRVWETKVAKRVLQLDNMRRSTSATHDTADNNMKHGSREAKDEHELKRVGAHDLKKARIVRRKEKREKGLCNIKERVTYAQFVPLNELWNQYINDTLKDANGQAFTTRMLKADFHGAIVTVIQSKCPSLIAAEGIVIKETSNTFQIINKANKLKVIPKQNSIFSITACSKTVTLYGNNFMFRSADRSARKFKYKPTIQL